ncbi:MAG: sulfatase, partial [Cyclobacteriaceae bacterium]
MYANHIGASHMRTGPWFSDEVSEQAIETFEQYSPEGIPAYEAVPPASVRMFTEYLRESGYYCSNNAKQDYQFRKTPAAWDRSGREASWKDREPGQPFFAVFNFNVTHESMIWNKAEDSLWVDDELEVPVPPYLPDTEIGRKDIRRMYSNIREMDAQVQEVLAALQADGLLDSTIVIWYSDHGGPLPRQKRAVFDSGVKVPMIIRFPERQFAGRRDDRMISFIDLAPTMLSLAGIKPPPVMDGSAFLGEYVRESEPSYIFGAADRFDEITDRIRFSRNDRFKYIRNYMPDRPLYMDISYRKQMPVMQELIRLKDGGQLTEAQARWFEPTKPEEELYDVINDPYELNNLAPDPDYSEVHTELSGAMDNWLSGFQDTGLIPEADLIRKIW